MKKIIESDLIAIAHRILKLRDKSDIDSLHSEAQKLYEKLTVLKFYEENLNRFDQAPEQEKIEELLVDIPTDFTPEQQPNPIIQEEIINKLPENVSENQPLEEEVSAETKEKSSFEVDAVFNVPFEKVEFAPATEQHNIHKTNNSTTKSNKTTVNDTFAKSITLTLNDRIAFEKHLFNNNTEDLNRVISQLNTMSDWNEVETFVNQMVKPDFNHWQGKEEYENRFMAFIQKRFL